MSAVPFDSYGAEHTYRINTSKGEAPLVTCEEFGHTVRPHELVVRMHQGHVGLIKVGGPRIRKADGREGSWQVAWLHTGRPDWVIDILIADGVTVQR